jgi:fructokinase
MMLGGVEAGGTKFVCAVGRGPSQMAGTTVVPTTTPDETLGRVVAFFTTAQSDGLALASLGVGSFGPLDLNPASSTYGSITTTLKPGWSGADVVGPLRAALRVPVVLDTDVNSAAYGEYRWGAGTGLRTCSYVTVGTGIGAGTIVDGRPLHGLLHPEVGHLPVRRHPDDRYEGGCPYHGDCLEGLAAGPALLARTGRPPGDLGTDADRLLALEAWYLAQLVSTLVYVVSPQRIIIGGGVLRLPGLLAAVRAATTDRVAGALAAPELRDGIDKYLVPPQLGGRAGVLGAIALAADPPSAEPPSPEPPSPEPPSPEPPSPGPPSPGPPGADAPIADPALTEPR